jgi:predicted aspartyl protease
LRQHPNDADSVAGLVLVLLRQQKVDEAVDAAKKGLSADPKSAVMMVALAEAEYRSGAPWQSAALAGEAYKADPCNARLYLMLARLSRLDSMYATSAKELRTAHALDPHDPAIRKLWLNSLPTKERIAELEAYLESPAGDDAEDTHNLTKYLDWLKKRAAATPKACRLASAATSTEIPFVPVTLGAKDFRGFGLDVKINGNPSRLQIDTGASGLLVTRSVANRAGLKPYFQNEVGGIGEHGARSGYLAYADSIQVGGLEFHDCLVQVIESRNAWDLDGLIGTDVFWNFLVTLDYPARKLGLAPLPARPDETARPTPSLETDDNSDDADDTKEASPPGDGAAKAKAPTGPSDRYIAPEMKDYTRLFRVGHMLLMPTSVNNSVQRLFVLDTGAWTTTISPTTARQVTKVYRDDRLQVHGISGDMKQAYTADDVTLTFGGIQQPGRNVVAFDTSSIGKAVGLDLSGFIGATTLGQLTTHIDYRDGLVKFDYDPKRVHPMN